MKPRFKIMWLSVNNVDGSTLLIDVFFSPINFEAFRFWVKKGGLLVNEKSYCEQFS